jgi:hypothetical protein
MTGKIETIWLLVFATLSITLLSGVLAFQLNIDPFGVWGSTVRPGINNSRTGQVNTDRMFKPYQLIRTSPAVVFLGTSHVEYGLPPRWHGVDPERVYNFGIGTLNVKEALAYAEFIAAVRSVRIVAIEVDPVMFGGNFNSPFPGFSQSRLNALAQCPVRGQLTKLKETVFNFDAAAQSLDTIAASRLKPTHRFYDDAGWFVHRGEVPGPIPSSYRSLMWNYAKGYYRRRPHPPEAFKLFSALVSRLKQKNIEVVLFTSPLSIDLQMIMDAQGQWNFFESIKRQVVTIAPLWDFGGINSVTRNLRNYSDGSHYLGKVGLRMIDVMSGGEKSVARLPSDDFGVLLTQRNVEPQLQRLRADMEQAKAETPLIYKAFENANRNGNQTEFNVAVWQRYSFK